ncbi:MAG: protease inhibitor I42 family protein [Alphaproteobacteria bacterium]|nr:protease inhibitor I42 family protein [Alphaproteobacteria bacterium]
MNTNKFLAGLCMAALFATGSQAMGASPDPLVIHQADAGKSFTLAVGRHLSVLLKEQAGTGYSWVVAGDSTPLLKFEGSSVQSAATMPGGAQLQALDFLAVAAGKGMLRLDYRRPWETDKPPAQIFSVTVTVAE